MTLQRTRRHFLKTMSLGIGSGLLANTIPASDFAQGLVPRKDKKKWGVALVGLGSYAKNQLAVGLSQADNCYLAGIVTGSPEKAVEWSKKYNIPSGNIYNYQNFDQIAGNKDIDIIYIVLPNSMHHEYVLRAAKAGKHVFCEKPMAISVQEAVEMVAACKNAGVQLGIGYRMHFEPVTKEVIRMAKEKTFGELRFIQTNFGFSIGDPKQWRLQKALAGGGPLMDVGIYCVQAARYVTGAEPLWVTAQFGPITDHQRFTTVEESVSWQMEFPGNIVVNGFTSYKSNIEQLYISANNGWMQLSPAYSYGPIKGRTSKGEIMQPAVHHQTVMLQQTMDALTNTGQFPAHMNGEEGLRDTRILMAIYEAATTGKRIPLV
jgi:predicted dehydrogenase